MASLGGGWTGSLIGVDDTWALWAAVAGQCHGARSQRTTYSRQHPFELAEVLHLAKRITFMVTMVTLGDRHRRGSRWHSNGENCGGQVSSVSVCDRATRCPELTHHVRTGPCQARCQPCCSQVSAYACKAIDGTDTGVCCSQRSWLRSASCHPPQPRPSPPCLFPLSPLIFFPTPSLLLTRSPLPNFKAVFLFPVGT